MQQSRHINVLIVKASTRKTPQPSPAALSDLQSAQALTGTTRRLASLRKDCLERDRHWCVISRSFDRNEATRRIAGKGTEEARDDDGIPLNDTSNTFATLEVAHIIPHSLMNASTVELDLVCSVKILDIEFIRNLALCCPPVNLCIGRI